MKTTESLEGLTIPVSGITNNFEDMTLSIEDILSELVIRVQDHFKLKPIDALAAVCQSKLANTLCKDGNPSNLSLDELIELLYAGISRGE